MISILLIILSILCPFFALTALEAAVPDVPPSFALGEAVNRMWIFYLFLPIPTASIIFGFYQNKKGIRNVRNIVVGLILAVILAVYGSFTPIFKDSYISDNLAAEKYAAEINIELPKSEKCVINKLFEDEVRSSVLCEKTSFDAFFKTLKATTAGKKSCRPSFRAAPRLLRSANTTSVLSIMPTLVSSTPSPRKAANITLSLSPPKNPTARLR